MNKSSFPKHRQDEMAVGITNQNDRSWNGKTANGGQNSFRKQTVFLPQNWASGKNHDAVGPGPEVAGRHPEGEWDENGAAVKNVEKLKGRADHADQSVCVDGGIAT